MDLFDIAIARKLSGGGGGSSDFSTATITVVGNLPASIPFIMTTEMGVPWDTLFCAMQGIQGDIQVPLYKGKLVVEINADGVTVSGNIESMGDSFYLITGDCTITIS